MAAPPPFMPLPFPFPAPAPPPASKPAAEKKTEGPEDPSRTLYVNNLNDRVRIDTLKRDLSAAFSQYGDILQIVAKKAVKMRGQAFVVFKSQESADKAKKDLQDFPLHNKPMNIQYSKTKSDDIAKLEGTLEENKRQRVERKAAERAARGDDEEESQPKPSKRAPEPTGDAPEPTKKKRKTAANPPAAGSFPGFPGFEMPNATLFLTNLPAEATQPVLQTLFQQYPGLKEIRMIPGRADLAFVEYVDENQSSAAKNALNGYKLTPEKEMVVSFAKK